MSSMNLITQPENNESYQTSSEIQKLTKLKQQIIKKMQYISVLNVVYKQKGQMLFLKTFSKIMDQLSQQLKNAVQAYQNIDKQIQRDPKCLLLRTQVQFYKEQGGNMQQIYQNQLEKLKNLKQKNSQLKKRKKQLMGRSIISHQKYLHYRGKNKSLNQSLNKLNIFEQQQQQQSIKKKATQSTKLPTSANKTRVINTSEQKYHQFSQKKKIYSKRFFQNRINLHQSIGVNKQQSNNNKVFSRGNSFNRQRSSRKVYTSQKKVRIFSQSFQFN